MLEPLVDVAPLFASAPVVLLELGDDVLELGEVLLAPWSRLFDAPLVAPVAPEASDGVADVPLVVPLEAPDAFGLLVVFGVLELPDVPELPVPVMPDGPALLDAPDVPDVPFVDGAFSSTSPAEVPVVVPLRAALPLDGTQFVLVAPVFAADVLAPVVLMPVIEPVVEPVVPAAPVVVLAAAPDTPPLVLAAPFAESVVLGVVPVPFAPFVLFSPVKR